MKVLLDENLPDLKALFSSDFQVFTIYDLGWQSKQNGELLLALSENNFDVLLTADRNLPFQQNLAKYAVRVAVLRTFDNRYKTLATKVSQIETSLRNFPDNQKLLAIDLRQ